MKKVTGGTKYTKVNEQGEVIEEETIQSFEILEEDNYIKLYIKHINIIRDLPLGLEGIICELIKCMNYGNKIVVNSHIKREIAESLGKSFNTVNQYITKLVDNKILIREGRGVYYLNPMLYGKGKWKEISELRKKLEINIQYDEDKYIITHK